LAGDFGSTAGRYGAVPNMIGDFLGTSPGTSTISKNFFFRAQGQILTETPPGAPDGSIGFTVGNSTSFDFYSVGLGADRLPPSPQADTFQVTQPGPGSSFVLPPPPNGFANAGGVAQNPTGTYDNFDFWDVVFSQTAEVVIPGPGGLVVGRMKLAENVSPLPRDRVFFNYSFFDNVPLRNPGINMSRYTPGFEKTFFNEMTSFELRAPFASTLDSQFAADTVPGSGHAEFGDVFMAFKALVCGGATWDVSGGLSLTLPTADNTIVGLSDGTELVKFENKSVHVMPFVGGLWTPSDRFFAQGFVQVDIDANGDPVYLNQYGTGLLPAGRMQETNFLYADLGIGYWMYRAGEFDNRPITGIAPTLEIHHNASLQSADVIRSGAFQIGQEYENVQMTDLVAGATVEWKMHSTLTAGYVIPVGDSNDQQFDGELRLFWNRWF
jgi:hypothetical protein